MEVIRSRANPALQRATAALAGRDKGVVVLEGDRLIDDALAAGFALELVLVAERRAQRVEDFAQRAAEVRVVDDELLDKISALSTSQGLLALGRTPLERTFATLRLGPEALVLIVAGISDPGNLGALARSAEAAGVEAIGVVAGGTSPWNSKALRGSMGSLLRVPVVSFGDAASASDELREHGFRQVRAATRGGSTPSSFDWDGRIALWVGSETGALPPVCESFERVTIPMRGAVESLNVTVAASLLLFAAGRAEDANE